MIHVDCKQGSREWEELRLGIPTASAFSRIITPKGKLSAQRDKYRAELLVERVFGEGAIEFDTEWTERGRQLEGEARQAYGLLRDVDPTSCGFCFRDESRSSGCSPDALVGELGTLELKCPMPKTHVLYLASPQEVPREYSIQVQGQLWVTGRAWADFMSYCPMLPPFLVRVLRDPQIQWALDEAIPAFLAELEESWRALQDQGIKHWRAALDEAQNAERQGEIRDFEPT